MATRALTLAAALWRFWWLRGHIAEGRKRLETALAVDGSVASAARATALDGAGVLAETQGDYDRAEALHRESLALSRERSDKTGIARALGNLGMVAFDRGDADQATALLEESLALAREIGDQLLVATALNDLGIVAHERGDLDRAEPLFQESLALRRQAGSGSEIARPLNNLAAVAFARNDFDRACQLFAESLSLYRDAGDRWGAAGAQLGLAVAIHLQGDAPRAVALLEESRLLFREVGDSEARRGRPSISPTPCGIPATCRRQSFSTGMHLRISPTLTIARELHTSSSDLVPSWCARGNSRVQRNSSALPPSSNLTRNSNSTEQSL